MKNLFGRRFISEGDLMEYAHYVGLFPNPQRPSVLEYLERIGLINPVARIHYPPEIVRRWHRDSNLSDSLVLPIEGDTPRFEAASYLQRALSRWNNPTIFGEHEHPLDDIRPEHLDFIQSTFVPTNFRPWNQYHTVLLNTDGTNIHDAGHYTQTLYHYWTIFPLASYVRSGLTIWYDVQDPSLVSLLARFENPIIFDDRFYGNLNLEARLELARIRENRILFDAVAYFIAYRENASRAFSNDANQYGRLPRSRARQFKNREKAIADRTFDRFHLTSEALLNFIQTQCDLWRDAQQYAPPKIAEQYRHNIQASINLYRLNTSSEVEDVIQRVGRRGDRQPILRTIFPDWRTEQRDLASRSITRWLLPAMSSLPTPYAISQADIDGFFDWLENEGLYQIYWHFRRLLDLGFDGAPEAVSAFSAEIVSYANTIELLANALLKSRGISPRGKTLAPKIWQIVELKSPALVEWLVGFKNLTNTRNSTLKRRLAQIGQIRRGGAYAPILRALLKLIVIRNEGTHLGLQNLDTNTIYSLIEALSQASILLWKTR